MKFYRHSLQNHINKFSWMSSDLKNNKSPGSEETLYINECGRKADFLRPGNTVDLEGGGGGVRGGSGGPVVPPPRWSAELSRQR